MLADGTHTSRAKDELDDWTDWTGGHAVFPNTLDDVHAAALSLAHQVRSQYTIAYSPQKQVLDGSFRQIRVDVRGGDHLSVRTRSGYLASVDDTAVRAPLRRR